MESGLEAEKLQREVQESQVNEEEVKEKIEKVKGEIDVQGQQSLRLENGIKAVERSLGQATKRLQVRMSFLSVAKEKSQTGCNKFVEQVLEPMKENMRQFPQCMWVKGRKHCFHSQIVFQIFFV